MGNDFSFMLIIFKAKFCRNRKARQ